MSHDRSVGGRGLRRVCGGVLAAAVLVGGLATSAAAAGLDNGAGTKAATNSPNCDAERGRIIYPYVGWVPCVKEWKEGADNGGATTSGVTEDAIKVVVLGPTEQQIAQATSPTRDRATGATATVSDAVRDTLPIFEKAFQTWGRKVNVEVVQSSGTDETAQRADAVKLTAMKPFAVVDLAGASVAATDLAKNKILVIGGSVPNPFAIAQSPYRWPVATDGDTNALLAAELIRKTLAGKPAAFAGDPAYQSQKRVFGTVRPDDARFPTFEEAFAELQKGGVKLTQDLTYQPPLDSSQTVAQAQELAPNFIQKLKAAGVTSVLVLSPYQMVTALTKAATEQDYHPEWIVMGVGNNDISILTRQHDQEQWKHAFGTTSIWVPVADLTAGPSDVTFQWFWGPKAGVYSQGLFAAFDLLFAGVQMAGPKLTPANFKTGMFSRPPVGGAAEKQVTSAMRAYGKNAGLPYDEYLTGGDVALVYWDADTTGPSTATTAGPGKGVYRFVNDAKRYVRGELPTKLPAYFDNALPTNVNVIPTTPAAEKQPAYPCTGCPSETGTRPAS